LITYLDDNQAIHGNLLDFENSIPGELSIQPVIKNKVRIGW
jgi:hypothetical protein